MVLLIYHYILGKLPLKSDVSVPSHKAKSQKLWVGFFFSLNPVVCSEQTADFPLKVEVSF